MGSHEAQDSKETEKNNEELSVEQLDEVAGAMASNTFYLNKSGKI